MTTKPIKSFEIKHFKFFTDNEPINIDGKHLLVYGENGSGKSSIYWALYTLLEACSKTETEINKYFTKGIDESLVNIYRDEDKVNDSFVRLELTNGTNYKIGFGNDSLTRYPTAQITQRASDFMNYRFIYKISDCRHKDEIDLFPLFEKEVFPYVKTRSSFQLIHDSKQSNDFNEIWDDLTKGPQKPAVFEGPAPVTTPSPTTTIDVSRLQKEYADKYWAFIDEINSLATEINITGNKILEYDLGYNIQFEIICVQISSNNIDFIGKPKILLKIRKYDNLNYPIAKPQSFLNEAKLTAIGIAIRFAILAERADFARGADFQLLVIDDLLISLDMSNRRKVLDMLLNNYADTYQLFILTHDRAFFEFAKRKIEIKGQGKNWIYQEMYEDLLSKTPKPYFKPIKTNLQTAEDYFKQHDYPACGIYLRKRFEELLKNLLPTKYKKEPSREDHNVSIDKNLNDLISTLQQYCKEDNIDYSEFSELKTYKDAILNPLAHNDFDAPFHRNELEILIKILEKLEKIKRGKVIHQTHRNLNFVLSKPDGSYFSVRMKTKEPIVLIEEDSKKPRISNFTKCKVSGTDNNGAIVEIEENFDTLKEVYDEMRCRFDLLPIQDLSRIFDYDGQTFDQKITTLKI
jgi:energy-coupling factor transporter ATP-binding protein EcfA2